VFCSHVSAISAGDISAILIFVNLYVLLEQYFKYGADFYSPFLRNLQAQVFCSQVSAISAGDIFAIKPHGFADGEKLSLGPRHTVQWFDTPHLPHG
jgi:hypothetical protein